MIEQRDNPIWHKLNAMSRRLLLALPYVKGRSIFVNEYPKSGGSWLTLMLSEILDLPFARNRLPHARAAQIFHGHHLSPQTLSGMPAVLLWRDGRDVLVSLYYHCLFYNDKGNKVAVDRCRAAVPFDDYVDIASNLPAFIRFIHSGKGVPRFAWAEFARQWVDRRDCVHTFYEVLFDDGEQALTCVLKALGFEPDAHRIAEVVATHSIERYRSPGSGGIPASGDERLPFVRRGGHGGWREHFSREAAEAFRELDGAALVALGYEADHSWVERIFGDGACG